MIQSNFQQFKEGYLQIAKDLLADYALLQLASSGVPQEGGGAKTVISPAKNRLLTRLFEQKEGSLVSHYGVAGKSAASALETQELQSDLAIYFDSKQATTRANNPLRAERMGPEQLFFVEELRKNLQVLTHGLKPEFLDVYLPNIVVTGGEEKVNFRDLDTRLQLGLVQPYFAAKEQQLIASATPQPTTKEAEIENPYQGLGNKILVACRWHEGEPAPAGGIRFADSYYVPLSRAQLQALAELPAGSDWSKVLGPLSEQILIENGQFSPLRTEGLLQYQSQSGEAFDTSPKGLLQSMSLSQGREFIFQLAKSSKHQILPLPGQSVQLTADGKSVLSIVDIFRDAKGNFVFAVYDTRDQASHLVQVNLKELLANPAAPVRFMLNPQSCKFSDNFQQTCVIPANDRQATVPASDLSYLELLSILQIYLQQSQNSTFRTARDAARQPGKSPGGGGGGNGVQIALRPSDSGNPNSGNGSLSSKIQEPVKFNPTTASNRPEKHPSASSVSLIPEGTRIIEKVQLKQRLSPELHSSGSATAALADQKPTFPTATSTSVNATPRSPVATQTTAQSSRKKTTSPTPWWIAWWFGIPTATVGGAGALALLHQASQPTVASLIQTINPLHFFV